MNKTILKDTLTNIMGTVIILTIVGLCCVLLYHSLETATKIADKSVAPEVYRIFANAKTN